MLIVDSVFGMRPEYECLLALERVFVYRVWTSLQPLGRETVEQGRLPLPQTSRIVWSRAPSSVCLGQPGQGVVPCR